MSLLYTLKGVVLDLKIKHTYEGNFFRKMLNKNDRGAKVEFKIAKKIQKNPHKNIVKVYNINENPLFIDSDPDFPETCCYLSSESPCIDAGSTDGNWSGDFEITDYSGSAPDMGAFESEGCSNLGDVNGDGGWNVLDVVSLVNCVLGGTCAELENSCAGDVNSDGGWNVLDVVSLVNCVLAGTCGS